MTIRNRPNYGVYSFDLTDAAGLNETNIPVDLYVEGTRIALVSAVVDGEATNAVVNVQIGRSLGDPIPFSVGTELVCQNKFDFARLTWSAQSGVTASFVISDDADGNGMSVSAYPTIAAADVTITEGGNTAKVNSDGQLEVTGSVSVGSVVVSSGSIAVTGGTIAVSYDTGTEWIAVGNPALNALPQSGASGSPQVQPGELGSGFAMYNDQASGSTTIITPSANTNGVVLRTANLYQGSTSQSVICAGTEAPTSIVSNPVLLFHDGELSVVQLMREIFLPAGQGLYLYGASTTLFASAMYTVL